MSPLRDLHDRDVDRLLAGRSVMRAEADDLVEFVRDVRNEHLRPMTEDVEARHVAAMAQAARDLSSTGPADVPAGAPARPRRVTRSLVARNRLVSAAATLAAVTVTAGLGTVGLAVAGVKLPDAASEVFGQVGVTLPNQDEPSEALRRSREARADAVRRVIAATPPAEREGCAFGQRLAEAARGEALPAAAKEACAAQEARRAEREREREQDTPSAGTDVDAARGDGDGSGAGESERARGQRTATPAEGPDRGQETTRAGQRDRGGSSPGNGGGSRGNGGGSRGNSGGGDNGGSPPDPRPGSGGGEAPSPRGRPDDAGPRPGERRGPPEGTGRPGRGGAPEGTGPSLGEGRGRPEGAGRP